MNHGDARGAGATPRLLAVSLAALGVVFGDIGTSPLYAMRECFHGPHAVEPTPENVLGVLSLIFWSLVVVISVKYLVYIMRADNRGEGGILALTALAVRLQDSPRGRRYGFMDDPDAPRVLGALEEHGLGIEFSGVTYFLGRETLIASVREGGMAVWREKLFAFMSRNARRATVYFSIPPEQVIEVGAQVEL